jgi:hypothetical protein
LMGFRYHKPSLALQCLGLWPPISCIGGFF